MILVTLSSCGSPGASVVQKSSKVGYAPNGGLASHQTIPIPIGVSLQGTTFYSRGLPITLIGFNRPSLEYSCTGDGHFTLADFKAMGQWGANVVRITLSSEFWADAGGDCPSYHDTVMAAVANARAEHLFVILDLQWSAPFDLPSDRASGGVQCPMPDTGKDVAMWHDLAAMYRGDTGILFDLYGEPYNVAWSTWLNGGTVNTGCYVIGGPSATMEYGTYQAIGMRELVTIVRAIAPENIIVVSGNVWGYDLSTIPYGFAVQGRNIVYDTHPFDYTNKLPGDWYRAFGYTAQSYPVMAAEFGSYDCGTQYDAQAIAYFTAHHMSWLAWAWQPGSCSGPSLLANWSGTPNSPYGSFIQQQMLAAAAAEA